MFQVSISQCHAGSIRLWTELQKGSVWMCGTPWCWDLLRQVDAEGLLNEPSAQPWPSMEPLAQQVWQSYPIIAVSEMVMIIQSLNY